MNIPSFQSIMRAANLPDSGVGPGVVTVSIDPSGLAVGSYSASITVTDLNTSNGKVFPVNLTVYKKNSSSAPFGAIDTPIQGGIASGKYYVNFGWVLTPQPNTITIDGSTIYVWVDGVALGHPFYNKYRSDIADLFPGYNNSSWAGGHFYLDTTQYTNGVHTISWSAEDIAGNVDGIGSRYFTIVNADSSSNLETKNSTTGMTGNINPLSSEFFQQIKPMGKNIRVFDSMTLTNRIRSLTIKELEYVALRLVDKDQLVVRGFLEVYDRLNPLPIGSTLDTKNGIFYWHPGPGFFGQCKLVFVIESPTRQSYKKIVIITIETR